MIYPGTTSGVKSECTTILVYGMDNVPISKSNIKKSDTTQGNLVIQDMGQYKCPHIKKLLLSLGINKIIHETSYH